MTVEDWSTSAPVGKEGWGDGVTSVPLNGWGDVPSATVVRRPPPKERAPPPRLIDDEAAAKEVDALCATVLANKKKLAALRVRMEEISEKQQAIQSEIDLMMPALQELRASKALAMGQLAGAKVPAVWMDKAKELNNRRRSLPGGCTSVSALKTAIKDTDHLISHGSLTLKEEKAALERLRELKKGMAAVEAYEADQAVLDQVRDQYSTQQAELKPLNHNFDQLKAAAEEKGAEMTRLMAAREQQREARSAHHNEHAALKEALDKSFEKVS